MNSSFGTLVAYWDRAAIEPARAFWAEAYRITAKSGIEVAKAHQTAAQAAAFIVKRAA